jgi:endonuclease G
MYRPSLLLAALALLACSQQQPTETAQASEQAPVAAIVYDQQAPAGSAFPETFEAGAKGGYAPADEPLTTGSWRFEDALIGSADQDHKAGQHAARLRNQGRLTMNFDAAPGVRLIRIKAAAYGTDGPSTWELWLSRDGGRSFQRSGQPVVTKGARLVTTTFPGVNTTPLRLQIRKTGGPGARLNIDDIELETASGPAPALTTGPGKGLQTTAAPVKQPTTNNLPPTTGRDDNLALGNPSGATSDPANATNYLLRHPQFAIGYNARRGTPTWVCWHLSRAWLGQAPRQDDFRADAALPREFYQVTPKSYAASGFDKGHNCPSGDRTADLDDNSATFLMTNMVPQAPQNNQQTWNHLEAYTRDQLDKGQEAYVLMGSYGRGGTGSKGLLQTLDQGRVTVPARIWKVIVFLPEGPNDLQRITAGQGVRVLAVDTPNDNSLDTDWHKYLTSVDKIEQATGLDLLSALPQSTQARLQKLVDAGR